MNCLLKVDSNKILHFLKSQEKSLKSLNLIKLLHGSGFNYQSQVQGHDIENIFKQVGKMQKLEFLTVAGIDLINHQSGCYDYLNYLNIQGLYLHIRYFHTNDLKSITKALFKTQIRLEYVTCQMDNDVIPEGDESALDNIHAISIELKVSENNTGWVYDAHWKSLKKLTVQDFNESKPPWPWKSDLNLLSGDFFQEKWKPTFPELTMISITCNMHMQLQALERLLY